MKWFWSIMLVLVVVTGVLIARRGGAPTPVAVPEVVAKDQPPARPAEPVPEVVQPEAAPVVSPVVEVPAPVVVEAVKPIVAPEALNTESLAGVSGSVEATPVESVTKIEPVVESAAKEKEKTEEASGAGTPGSVEVEPLASAPAPEEAKPVLFRDQFEVVPARTKPGENGFTIYDERFPVKGTGTPEDPLEISWDFLVSASETFQPRMGKKRLPERITMLDKKHVRVTGYIAFPIMAASQNEMLSMRNMWDGCCIGVPPTPYDAIEVKLKGAATGRDRFTAFGTIEGTMLVDPYIKGNWLLGLYLMEGATLSQLKEGGDPGKHGGM